MVLLGLGVLVVILYRQLAALMNLKAHQHQSVEDLTGGLPAGAVAPAFDYWFVNADNFRRASWHPITNEGAILLFGDPLCGSCERALLALGNLVTSGFFGDLECLVLTSESREVVGAVDAFRDSPVRVAHVAKEVIIDSFNLRATPYLLLVDARGTIAASGPVHDESSILQLVRDKTITEADAVMVAKSDHRAGR